MRGRISEQQDVTQGQLDELRSVVMKSLIASRKEEALNKQEYEHLRDFIVGLDIDTFSALFIAFGDCVMKSMQENGVLVPVTVDVHVFDVQD